MEFPKHITTEWNSTVWSDEKKFNFNGPDGYRCDWYDLRKEEKILSRRIQGTDSVMFGQRLDQKEEQELYFAKEK